MGEKCTPCELKLANDLARIICPSVGPGQETACRGAIKEYVKGAEFFDEDDLKKTIKEKFGVDVK